MIIELYVYKTYGYRQVNHRHGKVVGFQGIPAIEVFLYQYRHLNGDWNLTNIYFIKTLLNEEEDSYWSQVEKTWSWTGL